jgi:hypothetical protein
LPLLHGRFALAVGSTVAPGIYAVDGLDLAVQKDCVHHAIFQVRVPGQMECAETVPYLMAIKIATMEMTTNSSIRVKAPFL